MTPTQNTATILRPPPPLKQLEDCVFRLTGRTAAELRVTPIDELRIKVEKEAPLRIYSAFPFIGRGNVLRDKIISHAEVEAALTQAIRGCIPVNR
ncbi:MAG: hypothetical protein LBU43_00925 [Candidatus Accumulibacter sp.]|nr:hypothetical protein [Accumulibacter sp.]